MKPSLLLCVVAIFSVASTSTPSETGDSQLDTHSAYHAAGGLISTSMLKKVSGCALLAIVSLIVYEQISLARLKGRLPGPRFAIPLIGSVLELVRQPYSFWLRQESWGRKAGASWNYICGKFILLFVSAKLARIPFIKNSAKEFISLVHPNAEAVFGKDSVLFMSGPKHQALRGSFIKLFTRKAISVYLSVQEKKVQQYVKEWKQIKGEIDLRSYLRDLNVSTSMAAFVGPYIEDTDHFQQLMKTMGKAFVSLPISFPGSALWKTKRARTEVEDILMKAVKSSKLNMQAEKTPNCLLDFWSQVILSDIRKAEQIGQSPPEYTADFKMAITILDFLFAAQDASTSSLAHTVALMSDYPHILEKVREEQYRVNAGKYPITYEMLKEMTYTRQVVKEILRFRPPVPMWAHISMSDIEVESGCTAPKGSVVFSSITSACREDFTDPDKFDPDRMGPDRQEDVKHCTNYLVFGAGPHRCAGREYAMNHMIVFLSVLSTSCTWTRRRTTKSDELEYMPSAYPADLLITFAKE